MPLLVALAAVTLCACALLPSPPEPEAQIAPGLRFTIPAPSELGYSVDADQLVTARYRGEAQTLAAHLSVSPQRLTLIGFDPFGRRAFTITRTDEIRFEAAPGLPEGLRPGNILADVAIVYWPAAAVRRGLPSAAELRSAGDSRSIMAAGREIIRIDYDSPPGRGGWPRRALYRNEAFGYALDLRSTVTGP